ncbi:L domain-like protein [Saccharata proteae CBS 121410]|uniref:L domain-like protein n=1 Tax=Saccharata proteae CBS 121410 TaxID=1314787 RepID=A0A9P4HVE0_9PEZI|nr:L domain-like protein [Saccharata proteae CBS 121410]
MSRTPVSGSKTTIRKPKATPVTAKKISSTDTEVTGDPDRKIGNSSAALPRQEQRKDSPEDDQPTAKSSNNGFDFDFNSTMDDEDPFNQLPKGGEAVIKRRVANARSDGNMNIANMGLEEIPGSVMSMYEFDPNSDFAWGETVDLTKFNAADNKIVALPDDLFPDIDPPTDFDDDEVKGPQFGGLEKLDLHGNLLKQIPLGLRKLGFLTSLNLSRNPLGDECFDTISQIASLKELKLAENNLEGELPSSISHLENLEVLDLHGNKISSLPVSVHALASLRICNLTGNRLESAQLEAFEKTPLVELYLANNKLAGTFFTGEEGFTRLQLLDLSGNSLTAFSDGDVALPALCNLNISQNRISSLPDISTWTSLLSLQAGENKLSELPPGFSTLKSLKHANFDGNDIKNIDPTIGLMEKLETFSIAQNPLGQKKFLSMSTEDLKRSLLARIQPTEDEDATGTETLNGAEDGTAGMVPAANNSIWTVKPNGILDLSSHSLSTLDTSAFTPIATTIRQLLLRQNILTTIPAPLTLATSLTTLDLSSNHLTAALFPSPTHLPHLRTLHLSANRIPSLTPLTTTLTAPNLDLLDLTNNRLTGSLPALRASFPALTTLLAADNGIEIVTADALRGLTAVNLSNNSIGRLEPEIGLLAGAGLKGLEVGGNRFRVPGHAVLCKGSEAVLRWLRDKVPKDESVEEVGDGDDDGGF